MKIKINREQPFQVLATNFSIGPSSSGYDLQISADGVNYTTLFSVGANVTRMVTGVANGSYYKLAGNTDEDVIVNWFRQCDDGQGGGGSGSQGPQGPAGEAENYFLEPASALPQTISWETFEAGEFTNVRAEIGQDGVYLCHWNNDETFVGLEIENGEPSENQGYGFNYDENTGKYVDNYNYGIVSYVSDGYVYFMNVPSPVSTLDAYGLGLGNEGEVVSTDMDESTVAALSGTSGLYQVVDGKWQKISGLQGPQGPAGEGGQGGGDATTLQSVDVLNPEPLMGDVQAKRSYKTITGETTAEFTSGWQQESGQRPSLITGLDSIDGITFVYGVGRYELACDSEGNFTSTLVDGEDSIKTDGLYWNAKGDLSDVFTAILLDSEENTYLYIENGGKYWEISQIDNDNISGFEIPSTLTGSVTYEYEEGVNYSDGIYQWDGEDWQKEGILVVDELPEVGNKDTIYSLDGVLYIWNPNAGYAASWYKPLGNTQLSEGTGLVYAYPIEGQIIFNYSRNNNARVFKFHNGDLVVYEADQETVVQTITLGNTFSVTTYGSSYTIDGVYEKNYIGFRRNNVNISIGMAWDGYVDGGHYEVFNVENHPYTAADYGIPSWDDKGNVIRKYTSIGTKLIYVNATGTSTSNRMTVLTNGTGNGPDRWFAPVTGGNAGQMLISGGDNAAPVWSDWIKVVKITSDAYDALATKDPNTLYVIDDE